jgi:tRNA(Ile)-lysidine synthase
MTTTPPRFVETLRIGAVDCGLPHQSILLGVSGGPDSVAMLRGFVALREELKIVLAAAHFNHKLRGDASDADSCWIGELCAELDVPLVFGFAECGTVRANRTGIEEAAREERYGFLQATAASLGCTHVAVAHTADDQVETILHHIVRGTGLDGLAGMPARRNLAEGIALVRPMLAITRDQVLSYLAALEQDFRSDAMNADERFTRSRIRHSL